MPEKIDLKAGVPSNDKKKPLLMKKVTFEKVVKWIKAKGHSEEITKRLIKIASQFPDGTYDVFHNNFAKYLSQVQNDLNKEKEKQ